MKSLFDPVAFARGPVMRNRFMMGPLTNMQSLPNGRMSPAEYSWLEMRTHGGFGMMSTCAANVQANSAQLSGQLSVYDEVHLDPLRSIAAAMKARGNVALMQLNHGGLRSNPDVTGMCPVGPYDDPEWGGRAMTTAEIRQLIEDFVRSAQHAEAIGFDGVEIHGAHGQIMAQFLDPVRNQRSDRYGGALESRARLITEVLTAIRERCRPDFLLGLRLSVERYEINLAEFRELSEFYMTRGLVDFMDMSLWDCFKEPEEARYRGRPIIEWALDVKRGAARVGVAGKIRSAARAAACIEAGADFIILGRAAIIHEDFPKRVAADPAFAMRSLPVSRAYLHSKCVSDPFIAYLTRWEGFVIDGGAAVYTEDGGMITGEQPICFATADNAEPHDADLTVEADPARSAL